MIAPWSKTSDSDATSPAAVRDAVLRKFRHQDDCPADWPDDWQPQGPPMVRRESTVCRLRSPSARMVICVKIVHPKPNGAENSGSLYAALCHYHARSDHEMGFTVPQPYGWVPDHRAVIMEWVDGRNFNEILKREWFSARQRHASIRKAAGWLKWFHAQAEIKPVTLAKRLKLKATIDAFESQSELPPAATTHDPEIREFLEIARKSAKKVQAVAMDLVDLHGDFKPTNLLFSTAGTVVGIDFKGGGRGLASHDVCRFLSDLDFHRNLVGRSFALDPRTADNDFEVFLNSYCDRMGDLAPQVFSYLYFLTILRGIVHQRKKFSAKLAFRMRQAVVRKLAKKLSCEVSRTLLAEP